MLLRTLRQPPNQTRNDILEYYWPLAPRTPCGKMDRLTLPPVTNDKPFPNDWCESIDHRFDERDREWIRFSFASTDVPDPPFTQYCLE